MYLQRWHGWCHMKLQPSRRKFCVQHTTMHHVTSCKATYVRWECLAVTCHLHFWQNDWGLLRATAVTRGGTDTEIRVSTESRPWRRKFSRRSSSDSNPRPFNHESGALTTELSRCCCCCSFCLLVWFVCLFVLYSSCRFRFGAPLNIDVIKPTRLCESIKQNPKNICIEITITIGIIWK